MHGYGATTFGRLAAARRGWPSILHEHANLTDTPWFQKIADRVLAPYTDIAIAVSRSTADFVIRRRLIPPERTKVVYLGVPLEEFSRPRSSDEVAAARAALGIPPGTLAQRLVELEEGGGVPVPGEPESGHAVQCGGPYGRTSTTSLPVCLPPRSRSRKAGNVLSMPGTTVSW